MKLFGKNPVIERLRTNPSSVRKIYIQPGVSGVANIIKKARLNNIPVFSMPKTKMNKVGRNKNTQGIMVDVADFDYLEYDDLLENALKKKRCLLFLDGLKDPQNLGAIIRSVACLGKFSLILPTHESVSVTEAVLRVASGGDNYVQVSRVGNLVNAIKKAKGEGFNIAGTVVREGKGLWEDVLPFPLGVVIGSEQKGIRDVVKKQLDLEITIPMAADTMSLNAAHATTVICYEVVRQSYEYKKSKK